MLFITHLAFTLLFVILLSSLIDNPVLFMIIALIAAALPDIDSPKSFVGRCFLFRPINFFTRHRGIFHSILFMIGIGCFIWVIFRPGFYAFLFGYSLHLIMDCFTRQGVHIFYPFKIRIHGKIKTGGIFEVISLLVCLFIIFLLLVYKLFSMF